MKTLSTFGKRFTSASSLPETLLPPTIAAKGRTGSFTNFPKKFISLSSKNPAALC